jgi:hypothetical protein
MRDMAAGWSTPRRIASRAVSVAERWNECRPFCSSLF